MKKLLAVMLLAASPLVAQDSSVNKDGSNAGGGSGATALADITDLNASCATFLATPTSANLAACISNETGGTLAVFSANPTFTLLGTANGATGPGCIDLYEDSDNGTNKVTLCGPSSTADVTISFANNAGTVAITGTNSWSDGVTQTFNPDATNAGINVGSVAGVPTSADPGDVWYDTTARATRVGTYGGAGYVESPGKNFIRVWEEFLCGEVDGTPATENACNQFRWVQTGGGVQTSNANVAGVDDWRHGVATCLVDITGDQCAIGSGGNLQSAILTDGMRWQFGVMASTLADAAGDVWEMTVGGTDQSATVSDADPTIGVWAAARSTDGTDQWTINVANGSTTSATCTNAGDIAATTWYQWDIWYESGVGVHFILNGTECTNSPINATLPTGPTHRFRPIIFKADAISSTDLDPTLFIDYMGFSVPVPLR